MDLLFLFCRPHTLHCFFKPNKLNLIQNVTMNYPTVLLIDKNKYNPFHSFPRPSLSHGLQS